MENQKIVSATETNAQSLSDSDTDFDEEDSVICDSSPETHVTKSTGGTKRKKEKSADSNLYEKRKLHKAIMSFEDKKEAVSLLDAEKDLAVHHYIDFYNKDPLVRFYVDTLLEYKVIPILPPPAVISNIWLTQIADIDISDDLKKMLTSNFMKYFQLKYFNNNLSQANLNDKTLFKPHSNFWIPSFDLLPERHHEDIEQLTLEFVKNVQRTSEHSTKFAIENLILRNVDLTMPFLKSTNLSPETHVAHMENILGRAFTIAKIEFPKSRHIKVINWKNYDSDPTGPRPKWRKDKGPPPLDKEHTYTKTITEKLAKGDLVFDSKKIIEQEGEHNQQQYKKPSFQHRKKFS